MPYYYFHFCIQHPKLLEKPAHDILQRHLLILSASLLIRAAALSVSSSVTSNVEQNSATAGPLGAISTIWEKNQNTVARNRGEGIQPVSPHWSGLGPWKDWHHTWRVLMLLCISEYVGVCSCGCLYHCCSGHPVSECVDVHVDSAHAES